MRTRPLILLLVLALLAVAAAAPAGEIRFAALARPGTAQYTLALKFKELVEARSAGRYTVTIDPAGTPARESEVLEQLRSGGLHVAVIAAAALENLLPTTRVLSFPFLFATGEQADQVLDGPLGAAILRDAETIGCRGLGFTEGGFRHLSNSIRPVRTADDVRGLKIRVTAAPVQTAFWSALGAKPTPGPWPSYADLEAGVLEGQDNPLRIVEAYGFDEVQPYLSLTRHAYIAYLNLAALSWCSTLSP
ncbi:MAG: TRAP transporter substrate-binding protein DctP [Desulfobulbaceae bacterium]|nr:TRAP transporter substrate-binding protein DctP [Desulfobulbaceae bacterium]